MTYESNTKRRNLQIDLTFCCVLIFFKEFIRPKMEHFGTPRTIFNKEEMILLEAWFSVHMNKC